jgi:large-conductance mechanosensitive channel
MIDFLLTEGALTAAAFTGIFNTSFLTSLKNNIIEPCLEKFIKLTNTSGHFGSKFTENNPDATNIKWKLFIRDFIAWIFSLFIIYTIWKLIIHPYKLNKNMVINKSSFKV